MILAVCLNPALDITCRTGEVRTGASHEIEVVRERAGGKGINVARVLHQLGEPVTVTGLLGGDRGHVISKELAGEGIAAEFSGIAGPSRRTFAVVDSSDATVFNEAGPQVSEARSEAAQALDRAIDGLDQLVAAAGELRGLGATSVVLSSGTDGLVAVSGQGTWLARPPRLISGNPTGAGDALTAAIAAGVSREQTWPELLATGVAWSAAAVAMPWAGQVDESVMADVRSQVVVEAL